MNKIILVSGGSASGKSYVIKQVLKKLNNPNVITITMDDFYKDNSNLTFEERKKINFDHPKSMDFKLLEEKLIALKNGEEVDIPKYDFTISLRSKETQHIKPAKIIIVEGIFALCNKKIRALSDLNVFIKATPENRFLRRLQRDQLERAREYDFIVNQYTNVVAPYYEEIVNPTQMFADIIISNDGIQTKSIDILTSLVNMMIEEK